MTRTAPRPTVDICGLPEDERIEVLGNALMGHSITAGVMVDDMPGRADWFIEQMQARFPGIEVVGRGTGPVAGTILIRLRRKVVAHA